MIAIDAFWRSTNVPGFGDDANTTCVPSADQSAISALRGAFGPWVATSGFDGTGMPVSGSHSASVASRIDTIASALVSSGYGLPTGANVVNEPRICLFAASTASV